MGENGKKAPVILIVEDETLIRWGTVKMAEDAGFEVLEAADADEAIEILPEGGRFFPKPYSPFQIQSVLREWAQ